MKTRKNRLNVLWRIGSLFAAVGLIVAIATPVLVNASAGQVQSRSIEMSDGAASNNPLIPLGVGSGTSVTYNVSFTPATSGTIGGIVVDICGNTPLIGDTTCSFPTGFDWGGATPTFNNGSGMGAGTWTAAGVQAGAGAGKAQVLELSSTGSVVSSSTPVNFNVTTITNPDISNEAGTGHYSYYARILTFDTSGHMTTDYTTSGTTRAATFPAGHNIDNGGVALSTSTPISITSRVMETLSLCTSAVAPTANCGGVTAPAIILGHGPNNILDASAVDTKNVFSQLSTNAQSGAVIRMHSSNNACSTGSGGLSKDGGSTCPIPAIGSPTGTLDTGGIGWLPVAGTASFGVQVSAFAPAATGSGTGTIPTKYDGVTSPTLYAMDATTGGSTGNNVAATYGDPIFSTSSAVNSLNETYKFAATASNTTPAGIYTVQESLIATGTF